ncbi:MAG TPA: hypothetical protein VJX67_09545 [Blastocatellia bacterium]|nr:hypothetical protein [Blastocatellia bacterium]
MIIVADAAPLNYLVLIGEIEVLERLAGRVIIPQAVESELRHPKALRKFRSSRLVASPEREESAVFSMGTQLLVTVAIGGCWVYLSFRAKQLQFALAPFLADRRRCSWDMT